MVPHTFVILESLPLTPNGKIDRRALPEPNSLGLSEDSFVAPRNQIEEILTQIWAEVLRVKQVSIHDNFFALGGDSILSIQILTKAKQAGLQLSLKQLFGNQTIAQLAAVADTIKAIEVKQGLVTGTLPLTPIQHWFFEQNLSKPHHFNQSFLLSVSSDLKAELLKQALQQLLVHHDALRLRFTQSASTWQQIYSAPNDSVPFFYIDLSTLAESEQQAAIEDKAASLQASLNLSANLVQVAFFHLGIDKRARLLIIIHHLVIDVENYPVDTTMRSQNYGFDLDNIHGIEQTNYPLTVVAIAREQLLVKISYDTSRFDDAASARMLGHFQTLLEGIVSSPEKQISQLPLLTPSEQQQLIGEWNDTSVDYPVDKCIHQLFENQVERTPDTVAVVFENQQLTYWELNCRANQVAHHLKSLGVGADVLVGLCVERSLEMVVGLLAILKAGGAYVPLDPTYPQERLAYMLNDSQVPILLSQEKLLAGLPEHGARVVCLDTNWEDICTESQDNPISDLTTDNLAYVIYTSGSTGQPKGTLVNHNNVVRLFAATDAWYKFNSDDVWTLFHSYAFDFSVWEIWGALLYGGRLIIVPYLVTRSPGYAANGNALLQ